jgi:para-nitrobenzyl esterase
MDKSSVKPRVVTECGQLSGLYEDGGQIAVFKGIPYARPPLVERRWRPPEPAAPWSGVRPAETFGPRAMQMAAGFDDFMDLYIGLQGWSWLKSKLVKLMVKVAPRPPQSEDCLYLNVRSPALDPAAKLPVMVWLHGGDHQDGSGSDALYNSSALAHRGVVLVTINYRLGLMGYFAHPELNRESAHGVSGNYGTLDQVAALRWVQANIAAFGGDPDNVTVFGESAGGESVAYVLTSPLARGLFHKAILQSPANSHQMMRLDEPVMNYPALAVFGQEFADRFAPPGEGQLEALRQVPAEKMYQLLRQDETLRHFFPVVDGYVLPQSPFESFLDGKQARVPMLLGSNADEGTLLFPLTLSPVPGYFQDEPIRPEQVAGIIRQEFGEDAQALFALYPGLEKGEESAGCALFGDCQFGAAVHFYATQAAAAGQPVFLYFFTRVPPSSRQRAGAYHSAELTFVFGSKMPMFEQTPADQELSQAMVDYWAEFARRGDPNLPDRREWPAYSPADERQMQLGLGDDLQAIGIECSNKYAIAQRRLMRLIQESRQLRQPDVELA